MKTKSVGVLLSGRLITIWSSVGLVLAHGPLGSKGPGRSIVTITFSHSPRNCGYDETVSGSEVVESNVHKHGFQSHHFYKVQIYVFFCVESNKTVKHVKYSVFFIL